MKEHRVDQGRQNAIALTVAAVETGLGIWLEIVRQGATARAIHDGTPGLLLRLAALLTGPVPLIARIFGWVPVAAVCFLIGATSSRYGWVFAGRFSAKDPVANNTKTCCWRREPVETACRCGREEVGSDIYDLRSTRHSRRS